MFSTVCVQSSLRLQGGANNMTGRVEICFNNQWQTICDGEWGATDARVTCRQLGYSPNGTLFICSKRSSNKNPNLIISWT